MFRRGLVTLVLGCFLTGTGFSAEIIVRTRPPHPFAREQRPCLTGARMIWRGSRLSPLGWSRLRVEARTLDDPRISERIEVPSHWQAAALTAGCSSRDTGDNLGTRPRDPRSSD